ncbi:hypothetical protein BX666DRAFT_2031368 [Dichotomocladium elegans]|nr:hypothetical protein BX666DRAFT_2031368 [Dichotomocladium elegans]
MSNAKGAIVDLRLREKFKRRIQSPESLAPTMKARRIHLLTWAISIPLAGYVALFADFGPQDHCFSPLRRWFDAKRKAFWTLTPEEQEDLRDQGRLK